jgi:protein involved in polysaccharide export with SLBB domain
VSSVAGLFNALYQAGGPTAQGSFRSVEVWRGAKRIAVADLYDFLVKGDGSSDIRLEHNDRIFVPPAGTQVTVEGAVRRPAIYEMKPAETVQDLLRFAGGLSARALGGRIQIDRIMSPAEQTPGHYRRLVDVTATTAPTTRLNDGDVVRVSAVTDERRNRVALAGEVRNPGLYEWTSGMTLWGLLRRADGPSERAYTERAHIYRLVESTGARDLIQATLQRDAAGMPLNDVALADGDSVVVFSRAELRNEEFVTIDGLVKNPDKYVLAAGMTVRDLVLTAGGFVPGASVVTAEVSRVPDPLHRTDTTAIVYTVTISDSTQVISTDGSAAVYDRSLIPSWTPGAGEFKLQNGDRVFIRRTPGFEKPRLVAISGQVVRPGPYALQSRTELFTDVVNRAGGFTPEAYLPGVHVVRRGRVVAADLADALHNTQSRNNIVLEDGDSIFVPEIDQMVTVNGAVAFESSVLYRAGKGLDYYVEQAGGTTRDADKHRTTVTYPNGERRLVHHNIFWTNTPEIQPGSQIFVPAKPANQVGTNWESIITRVTAIAGTVATLLIAVSQIKN